jgi:hypothetical protein
MQPSRATQPMRRGARAPSAALTAMLRGRTAAGWNPADVHRAAQRTKMLVSAGRPKRPARSPRPARPPR